MSTLMDDVQIVEVHRRGLPGDGATIAEVASWRAERLDWLDTLNTFGLDDLADVDTAGAVDGYALIKTPGGWAPQAITNGITVTDGTDTLTGRTTLYAWRGINVTPPSDGNPAVAFIDVVFSGTGVADAAARSDHWHNVADKQRAAYTGGGYLSSGSRPAGSLNVTLNAGVTYLVEAWIEGQLRGADPGAAYYTISININGNVRTSVAGKKWVVQGVPNDPNFSHEAHITGTGTAITVSASIAYSSGAGLSVDDGDLVVRLSPNR